MRGSAGLGYRTHIVKCDVRRTAETTNSIGFEGQRTRGWYSDYRYRSQQDTPGDSSKPSTRNDQYQDGRAWTPGCSSQVKTVVITKNWACTNPVQMMGCYEIPVAKYSGVTLYTRRSFRAHIIKVYGSAKSMVVQAWPNESCWCRQRLQNYFTRQLIGTRGFVDHLLTNKKLWAVRWHYECPDSTDMT